MSVAIFAALSLACAALWAYTRGVQEASLFWGRRLGAGNELLGPRGMQDAITPPAQTTRNLVTFVSFLALPIVGVPLLGWTVALAGVLGSVIASMVIRAFLPSPHSMFFAVVLLRGLADRRAHYVRTSDALRVGATDVVIEKLKSVFAELHRPAAGDPQPAVSEFHVAHELVSRYGEVLEQASQSTAAGGRLSSVASISVLPASKQQIMDAIVTVARRARTNGGAADLIEPLKIGYASLADFVQPVDAEIVRRSEAELRRLYEQIKAGSTGSGGGVESEREDVQERATAIRERTNEEFGALLTFLWVCLV